jgi:hypothetical protein
LSPIAVALVAFAVILGGAFAGTLLRKALPDASLEPASKIFAR